MAAIAGTSAYILWCYSGGSIALNTDFRTFTWSPTLEFIDSSAGADTFKEYITGIGVPGDFSVEMVYQGTSNNTITTNLAQGSAGSLIYGPEGSTAGRIKFTIPATSKGLQWSQPYQDVITMTGSWQQTAQHTQGTF